MSDQSIKTSASPKVRKFARELGVDINSVKGSERLGRVVEKDLKEFVSSNISQTYDPKDSKNEKVIKSEYQHSDFGKIEVKDIPRVKKIAAPHLVNSWTNIPHVTNHDEADITEMEEFRSSLKDNYTRKNKNYSTSIYYKSIGNITKNFHLSIHQLMILKMVKLHLKSIFISASQLIPNMDLWFPRLETLIKKI